MRASVRAGGVTVYGTCRSKDTGKQLVAFNDKNIPYNFVNCDNEQCPTILRQFKKLPVVMGYPGEMDSWDGFQKI